MDTRDPLEKALDRSAKWKEHFDLVKRIELAEDENRRMRAALEKIAGVREYDAEDHVEAASYKPSGGDWTTDEYLADAALSQNKSPA